MLLALLLALQTPSPARGPATLTAYNILEAEYQRVDDVSVLIAGLRSPDQRIRRLSIRAFGRLERPTLAEAIAPFTRDPDPDLRREAVAALAQMGAAFDLAPLLASEDSSAVRSIIYEAMGRARPSAEGSEARLVAGLKDSEIEARTGAARGLESWVRLNIKTSRPKATTLAAIREVIRDNQVSRLRQFALLALNAVGDQDAATFDLAFRDSDPQVRRLAVLGSKRWVEDESAMVRLEAVRVAGTCEKAWGRVADVSSHVALAAVDFLGAHKCDPKLIEALVDGTRDWRMRTRALVALAKVAPEAARARLAAFRDHALWQVRAYAANAARIVGDDASLSTLSRDVNPNVAAAALNTVEQAVLALGSDHAGLLMAAAAKLTGEPGLKSIAPQLLATLLRLSRTGRVTVRDPRVKLIELLGEAGDAAIIERLRPLLGDRDPDVASLAAKTISSAKEVAVTPETLRYVPDAFPSEVALRALEGARTTIRLKGLGVVVLELLPDEAPAAAATFAALAEKGAYNGLTFHRVVPNFVLQGGSPGADEYDALTSHFMRDEVGFTSNERGTLGVSTRGHDTGDGQIFLNLVDNWRLDHTYTVFARVVSGMDVVDRILEGDVIESVRINRRDRNRGFLN